MRFRCAQCRALTQVQIPARMTAPIVTPCSGCGRKYRFAVDRPRGADDQDGYRRAKEFAETNQIDLASAYSVLEGVMTLDEARGIRKGVPIAASAAPAAQTGAGVPAAAALPAPEIMPLAADPGGRPAQSSRVAPTVKTIPVHPTPRSQGLSEADVSFDPGFAAAVRDGCLTPQQAMERGDHRALALRLSQRHRLSMALALKVAENRLTVHQALQQKAAIEAKEPPRPQTSVSHGVWNFMIFSVGALILAGLGAHVYHTWGDYLSQRGLSALEPTAAAASPRAHVPAAVDAPPPPIPPPPMTVPTTDSTGQVVEVVGPDPRSVLISFCITGRQSGRRQAIEIAPTSPPDASARWGVFQSLDNPAMPVRAILIRKDQRTGRWSAGDGRTPIMTEAAPPPAPGVQPVPVTEGATG